MKLNSVQEMTLDEIKKKPPYTFTYNSEPLPRRLSLAQDHWGYYNAAHSNTGLIPNLNFGTQPQNCGQADRDPNASKMKAGILEQIEYPTGGSRTLVYESHEQGANVIGGLRIKNITTNDDYNNTTTINYDYGISTLYVDPRFDYKIETRDMQNQLENHPFPNSYDYNIVSSSSQRPQEAASGSHIGYKNVTVDYGGTGTSEYQYNIFYTTPTMPTYPALPAAFIPGRGSLDKETHKDENGNIVTETSYQYQAEVIKTVTARKVVSVSAPNSNGQNSIDIQVYHDYSLNGTIFRQTSKTETVNGISTTTTYEYDPLKRHNNPIAVKVTNSDGTEHITQTTYAFELGDCSSSGVTWQELGLDALNNSFINVPVEVRNYINKGGGEELVSANLTSYKTFSFNGTSIIKPYEFHSIELLVPASTGFTPINRSNCQLTTDPAYVRNATIDQYTALGNPLQFTQEHDQPLSFIWNGDGLLPTAKVIKARHDEIAYTGFETPQTSTSANGNWEITGAGGGWSTTTGDAQTGHQGFDLSTARTLQTTINHSGNYVVSFWHKGGNLQLKKNSTNLQATTTYGSTFGYFETKVSLNVGDIFKITGIGYGIRIDDVRLYPVDALMTTVSYDENTQQVSAITDPNNISTYFEYDDFQRLHLVRDFEGNILSQNEYNYQDPTNSGNNHNFVKTTTATQAEQNSLANLATIDKLINIQYLDGLGRPNQSVAVKQSPTQKDVVQHIEYDEFGRTPKQFLPFPTASNNGAFRSNVATLQENYYAGKYGSAVEAYAETDFEASPLNRPLEQSAPGEHWKLGSGHTTRTSFGANIANEVWDFANNQFFAANTLQKSGVVNENGVWAWTYTDKLGRSILSKQELQEVVSGQTTTTYVKTYTVYDDFGRVAKVIPPEAVDILENNSWTFTQSVEDLIYQYRYDRRGRLVEKKIPGAAAQIMLYDPLDRVILTQDGNLRSDSEWQFTKYDILGRPVQTGITDWQSSMAEPTPMFGGTGTIGNTDLESPTNVFAGKDLNEEPNNSADHYTNNAYPDQSLTIHSVTWYDDYDFDEDGTPDAAHAFQPDGTLYPLTATSSTRIRGQIAGTKVLVLDGAATPTWLHTITHYDDRNRVIQIQGEHHLGGKDITTTTYDFVGKALQTKRQHTATGQNPITITNAFHYDHGGRLTRTDQTVNYNGTEKTTILSANEYDDLGQLIKKKLHSTNGGCSYLQETNYDYNIRGWMTSINDPEQMQGSTVNGLCEVEGGWYHYPVGGINQYTDVKLQPSENGAAEATYEGTTQFACGFRTQNSNGGYAQYMMLGRNGSNNKWYIWGQGWTVYMDKPSTFIQSGDRVRFERVGDDFKLYVNDNLEHTVQGGANTYSLDEIAGYCKTTGNNPNMAFYKAVPTEPADLFAMKFDYTTGNTNLNADAQYNGNISSITWKVKGREKAAYGFQYDDLNRLTDATFSNINSSGGYFLHNSNDFTVSGVSYDKQGNILTLNRKGMNSIVNTIPTFGDIDQLTYTYSGNQLRAVADAANNANGFSDGTLSKTQEYFYDNNGNMIADENKGLGVTYNHLNLPTVIENNQGVIDITYDAAGVKLKKEVTQGMTTITKDYIGGIEYADNTLEAIYHEEGRISVDNGLLRYEYTLKDHLGNSRVMFADLDGNGVIDETTEILQENHYYPPDSYRGWLTNERFANSAGWCRE